MFTGIKMPGFSPVDDQYKVMKIHNQAGDTVTKGAPFLEVECEKGTFIVSHFFSGQLTELNVEVGQSARKDSLIGVVDTPE